MKRLLMWVAVLFFISCATLTENQDDEQRSQTTIQYDEGSGSNGSGPGNGSSPPKPPVSGD